MTISVRKTVIEVDVSQALQAEARLTAANEARRQSARELAQIIEAGEREQIAALKASENEVKRATAARREQRLEARLALRDAVDAERGAKAAVREAAQAEIRAKRAVVSEEREWQQAIAATQRAIQHEQEVAVAAANAEQKELKETQRELARTEKLIRAMDKARAAGPGAGLIGETSQAAGEAAKAFDEWGKKFKGVIEFGSQLGNIASGVQAMIGMVNQAIDLGDRLSDDSIRAKNVGANLQVSIDGARDAFKGYVSDVELGRIANQAFELGVVKTGAELEELAAGVQAKAERLGVDSTQLFENAVTAIGRGSALILDNLGIVLDQAKAEEIYAKSLGVTIDQLSALQKEEAFQKAAMIEIARAGKDAASSVDGLAESWKRGRVEWQNFKDGILGFDDDMARVREAMRGLSEEGIERLRFGEVADDAGSAGKELNAMLAEWGVSLKDVRALADETGVSYQELLDKAQRELGVKEAERARKEMEATHRELAGMLNTRADELDQQAKITGILDTQGKQQSDILVMQEEALLLRLEAAEAIKDQNAQLEITRALEENRAKQEVASTRRRGGRRADPNAALERELKLTLAISDAKRSVLEAEAESVRGLEQREAVELRLVELAREELEVRQQAEEARKVRGKDAEVEREIALIEISTERRLLDMEVEAQRNERAKEAAQQRIAALEREIEIQSALGASVELLERQRLQASVAYLEQFGERSEQEAFDHQLAMERAEEIRAARIADEQAALDRFNAEVERAEARETVEQDFAQRRLMLEMQLAEAAGDTDSVRQLMHAREVARIKREVETRKLATSATSQLLTQGMGLFSLVADQAVKDEAKREKAMMRARGIEAMVRGAIETVEAVAAFASFNFVQGALHTAAAAVAYGTGISLLAGKVPAKQGASVGGAGAGGGAEHQTVLSDKDRGAADRGRAVVPASAEELIRLRQGSQGTVQTTASKEGGNVYQIGTIVAGDAGTLINDLDDQQARKWGTP